MRANDEPGLRKTVGWLLVAGTVLSVPISILAISVLESDETIGVDTAMSHLIADGGIFISVAFLLGMIGVERLLQDGKRTDYLRRVGLIVLSLGLVLEAISWIFTHLLTTHVDHGPETSGASELLTTEGTTLYSFAVSFTLVGVGLFALGTMNVPLMGRDRALATILGVIPGILGACLLLIGLNVEGDMIGLYQIGSSALLLQILWVFLIGLAFIRMKHPIRTGQETAGGKI